MVGGEKTTLFVTGRFAFVTDTFKVTKESSVVHIQSDTIGQRVPFVEYHGYVVSMDRSKISGIFKKDGTPVVLPAGEIMAPPDSDGLVPMRTDTPGPFSSVKENYRFYKIGGEFETHAFTPGWSFIRYASGSFIDEYRYYAMEYMDELPKDNLSILFPSN